MIDIWVPGLIAIGVAVCSAAMGVGAAVAIERIDKFKKRNRKELSQLQLPYIHRG